MPLPVSVLDLVPLPEGSTCGDALRHSLELAENLDRWGYHRVWYAEHHNLPTVASTAPELMIALAGARTKRIRVGAGGVMLPNHAPLKVAETYKMLEALYPGRVDLGIGRAPGTDPATAIALRGSREALAVEDFPDKLHELVSFGTGSVPSPFNPNMKVSAVPSDVGLPDVFLLASSEYGGRLAASLGTGFAFAGHFSDLPPVEPMREYRFRFVPGYLSHPYAILALSVIAAETAEEAEFLALTPIASFVRMRTGRPPTLLRPEVAQFELQDSRYEELVVQLRSRMIVGTAEEVWSQIVARAKDSEADEVMLATMLHDPASRSRSFELIAEVAELSAEPLPS